MQKEKNHYFLQTQSLYLKPYCKKYVKQYNSWFQNDQQLLYLTGSQPLMYQQQLQNHKSWITDLKKYTFLVFTKEKDKLIGDVNLFFSDWIQENQAEINIMIAVKEYRNKGYAKQIMESIEYFALGIYNKNVIIAKIKDDNLASIKFFQKIQYKFIEHNKNHGQVQYRKQLNKQSVEQCIKKLNQIFKIKKLQDLNQLYEL